MIEFQDYLNNVNWIKDLIKDKNGDDILLYSEWIDQDCLPSKIKSYKENQMIIYERLGESIFNKKKLEKNKDIKFIYIYRTNNYKPEAPTCKIYFDKEETLDFIKEQCKFMNYFCSEKFNSTKYGKFFVKITPSKPLECSNKILKYSDGIVIHLTSENGLEHILKEGLKPKAASDHPEQIYFLAKTPLVEDWIEEFCEALTQNRIIKNEKRREYQKKINNEPWFSEKFKYDNINSFVLIDIKKIIKHRDINIYEDTMTPGFPAYWTSEYIPVNCIIKYGNI